MRMPLVYLLQRQSAHHFRNHFRNDEHVFKATSTRKAAARHMARVGYNGQHLSLHAHVYVGKVGQDYMSLVDDAPLQGITA